MSSRIVRGSILGAIAAAALAGCMGREPAGKSGFPNPSSFETAADARGADPRAAFETSGVIGGLTASLERPIVLVAPSGNCESGVALALGGSLSIAAVARGWSQPGASSGPIRHELVLASGAKAALPGPALAMASAGDRLVVACADRLSPTGGAILCFKIEGEGESLVESWKKDERPADRLIAVPGGRVAVSDDLFPSAAARIYCLDALTGESVWSSTIASAAADLAYAPGLLIAAVGAKIVALDESTGVQLWSAAMTAKARAIAAGSGVAVVIADTGSLSGFSLSDGKGIGAAPGPFDYTIRPVADGAHAIAALVRGGACEIEIANGQTTRSWSWAGPTSFLLADRDRVYAGVDGFAGRGIFTASRAGDSEGRLLRLESGAFGAPIAVGGSRGGLLAPLMDGSLVLIGREMSSVAAPSALEAAVRPKAEIVSSIAAALGRFKPVEALEPDRYLRFDLFVQGMPVDRAVAFTAFAFDPETSARRTFYAKPSVNGSVVAIYGEEGGELAASIDEQGSTSSASAYMRKGKRYWIVAGWTYQADAAPFSVFVK